MDLQGFDAVVGITQDTVNFQLGFLHQLGVIAAAFTSSGAVGSLDVGATGPPTVTLVPGSGTANQVVLSLPLQSVGLSYPDGDLGGGAWFDAVTLVFRTSIATAQVTQADVQAMQAQLGGQVDVWSPLADFTDDVFSVRHVFLDLEGLSAADCDLVASGLQDTDASEVQVLVTQTVSHLNANAVQYLVGFGVTEQSPSAPTAVLPVFAPTYAQLVTSPYDPSQDSPPGVPDAGLSTLCWMTMLGALSATHSPPGEVSPLSSNVVGAAVRAEQVSGSFVISRQAWYAGYLDGLLWPVLKAMLGPQTAVSPLPAGGWLFQDVAAPEKSTSSGITVTESSSSQLTLQPPVNASASTVVLTGTGNLTSETRLREDVVFPQYASVTATASYAFSLTLEAGRRTRHSP